MLKALSRDPDHRYQTAGEFQEALLRCAHRHGLMMSAPELSEHLREVCGDSDTWRDDGSEHAAGPGTELYDIDEGTDQIDPDEMFGDSDLSVAVDGGQVLQVAERRAKRAETAMSKLTQLKNIELTSMINMTGVDHAGAQPLIDFNDLASQPKISGGSAPADDRRSPGHGFEPPSSTGLAALGRRLDSEFDPYERPLDPPVGHPPAYQPAASTDVVPRISAPLLAEPDGLRARIKAAMAPVRRPWLILGIILLLGVGTAAIIGLSGPTVESAPKAPAPSATPGPAASAPGQ
jgi:hypothetical protein